MTKSLSTFDKRYCESLTAYSRRKTRTVEIGDLRLGHLHPIRIQSMTTTDTMDTRLSVEQIQRMVDAGCELVRLTAPSIREAQNLEVIKKELHRRGIKVPLVADIHFTPNAAETAARIVEKVRINPGNYADKKKFEQIEYGDTEYEAELERIREKFTPLVKICKEYGTALRIGTNHGSLSDRIMSRYGDTPEGMVESAMEFLRICEDQQFYNIVLSMKSSNPKVMVEAYRLLVNTMDRNGMQYPLHLGVTEAGEGNDGRIKSALGIGALLEDGIGDTIRVSLTEDPEFEVPVARKLVNRYENRAGHDPIPFALTDEALLDQFDPFHFEKRTSREIRNFGGHQVPRVIADLSDHSCTEPSHLKPFGYTYHEPTDKWHMSDLGCDYIYFGTKAPAFMLPAGLKGVYDFGIWMGLTDKTHAFPVFRKHELEKRNTGSSTLNFLWLSTQEMDSALLEKLTGLTNWVLILESSHMHKVADLNNAFARLKSLHITLPVVIAGISDEKESETWMLYTSTDLGTPMINGCGDGVFIRAPHIDQTLSNQIAFGILQAARTRITKTEYISCPSCGRTLFDLQETTALIRSQTDHLKGIKIAIMGCIVNGPGEMADADYGYVGSGPGKITLYRGKEIVKKGVNKDTAVAELIGLIREDGNWTEPQLHN
ncbi:MAG: (E)-4-hydroxy-3-methylbut-2-enyl-diphosphate synthase [Bacteroidia bacterium]|jgi:(E)-4-hydroxy-3-methylbut-2-enyl-diphosphate synthase